MSKIKTGIIKSLSQVRFATKLLPENICYLCQQPAHALICKHCEQDCLFFNLPLCSNNLLNWPVIRNGLVKARYTQLRAAGYYQWPLDYLVREFKYGQPQLAATLAEWFCRYGLNSQHTLPDCLLPVPTSLWRYSHRQYHQTAMLSECFSNRLGIPTRHNWAKRSITGKSWRTNQQGLNRKARLVNLRHAYRLTDTPLPARVAIIDDVVTTGATVAILSNLLRQYNPTIDIEVWAIAVTPLKTDHELPLAGRLITPRPVSE